MRRLASACLLALLAAACAAPQPARSPFRDPAMTAAVAGQALTVGQTTKAQARALLGEPEAVPFDSGYEAWVYRGKAEKTPRDELVLLFDARGVLTKQRVRPAGAQAAR